MSVVFQKVCPETKPIVAADAPISERKAPRMLSALSFVISENILTMPKSRMNSIARDISLFLAIKMKRFSRQIYHYSGMNLRIWRHYHKCFCTLFPNRRFLQNLSRKRTLIRSLEQHDTEYYTEDVVFQRYCGSQDVDCKHY